LVMLGGWIFMAAHQVMPISVPVLAVTLTYIAITFYEYWRAWRTLGRFIGPDMLRQILCGTILPLHLGGREEEATAFVCDLRGFTGATEQMPLDALSHLTNEYTSTLVDVVKHHQGRPIDYQGDGAFVLFERPLAGKDYAEKAVRAALEMQEVFQDLQRTWAEAGVPGLEAGIGIATGTLMVGLVGAEDYMKPGAQGDAVNVAAHVQCLSRTAGYNVLITRDTYARVRETVAATYIYCGSHVVKGRKQPVEIYGVVSPRAAADIPDNISPQEDILDESTQHALILDATENPTPPTKVATS
ncbi:MAG: adenylate/guanylate cyclase domain-containing protein, partial [Armatimonadota bacterium]|nr:adenylate/guanylate cyclase domain-containing protein [Armatimonadota bacterium]